MPKFDPVLIAALRRRELGYGEPTGGAEIRRAGAGPPGPQDVGPEDAEADPVLDVAIKFTGPIEDLRTLGFEPITTYEHSSGEYTLSAGRIRISALAGLEDVPHVVKVEGSQPLEPDLYHSVPEARVDVLHEADPPLRGRGVIVGVIDSGFDLRHGNFRHDDEDETTRVLALWEQWAEPDDFPDASPPDGVPPDFGLVFERQALQEALDRDDPDIAPITPVVRDDDDEDGTRAARIARHGTHVAAIAAGDGSQREVCRRPIMREYRGVAPEADLLFVRPGRVPGGPVAESVHIVHAVQWILDRAADAGRPVVINISMGGNLGPHDGTSYIEEMIDEELRQAVIPCAIVKSAGNEGDKGRHADGRKQDVDDGDPPNDPVPANGATRLRFRMPPNPLPGRTQRLQLWYPGEDRLEVRVAVPTVTVFGPVSPGTSESWEAGSGQNRCLLSVSSVVDDPFNGDNALHVEITPLAPRGTPPAGFWVLVLRNITADDREVEFDCWIQNTGGSRAPRFASHVSKRRTINTPGTAREVITVGSYAHPELPPAERPGQLAASSSRGPTRDGRDKPDLVAPGVGIMSAKPTDARWGCFDWCTRYFRQLGGTSMAAPHVAGVVALMLEKNPNLSREELLQHLTDRARAPDGVNEDDLPDHDWGHGKLDAAATLEKVPPPADDDADNGDDGDDDDGDGDGDGDGDRDAAGDGDEDTEGNQDHAGGGGDGRALRGHPRRETRPRRAGSARAPADPGMLGASLVALHRQATATPEGARWAALVSRHLSEVRGLITTNRRIALCWHRMDGPQALQRLAGMPIERGAAAPAPSLADDQLHMWAGRFLDALAEHGSPRLQADVERYRALLLEGDAGTLAGLLSDPTARAA